MTHVEFIAEVAKRLEWAEENTTGIIETILDIISAELKLNNPVLIDEFGSLKSGVEPEYILVDPETKDRYLMPPAIEVFFEAFFRANEDNPFLQTVFLPDETLYNDLNLSFSQFEPTLLNEGVQFPGVPEMIVEEPEEEIETAGYTDTQKENIEIPAQPHSQQKEATEHPPQEDLLSVEHSTMLDEHGVGEPEKRKRIPAVWIPIAGGIAIMVASLFFFKGEE